MYEENDVGGAGEGNSISDRLHVVDRVPTPVKRCRPDGFGKSRR